MTSKKSAKSTPTIPKYIRRIWLVFLSGIALFVLLFLAASAGLLGEMPDYTRLENPQTNLATEIISSDSQTLGKFYFEDNRTLMSYDELPQNLIDALIATEDVRFRNHSGIDVRGTIRATMFLGSRGGASTISQQLAKQFFTGNVAKNKFERALQKVKEWVIAIRLERHYTKKEIIAMYFNIYDFGNYADGIRSASRIYFSKEPKDLTIEESATLVGMFKNSSLYNPLQNPVGTKNRRNVVLSQLAKYDYIDDDWRDSLQALPITLRYSPETHQQGPAAYFREYLRAYLKDWASKEENKKPDGTSYDIYRDGLRVFTTIDSRMQRYAEEAVSEHMPRLQKQFSLQNTPERNPTAPFVELSKIEVQDLMNTSMRRSERWRVLKRNGLKESEIIQTFKEPIPMRIFSWNGEIDTIMTPMDSMRYYKSFLRSSIMSMEPQTGHVKAWVGGINYKHFKYDMVNQGRRQVGSTFKPFLYATAIDQLQLSPCDSVADSQITIEANKYNNPTPWTPKNSGGQYGATFTYKSALANSVNTISAKLIDRVGPQQVIDMARKLGITSELPAVPSICLGTPDISLFEMVGAYSTFANKGIHTEPVMVLRIEDKNGTILFQNVPKTEDVLSEEMAYVTVKLMEGVTDSGSGIRLRTTGADKYNKAYQEIITGYPYQFTNPIAGKTGTTQNQSDGWFMGMVPNLVTGVWVGGEDRAAHFRSITYGQGASMALPIWGVFMKKCYNDSSLSVSKGSFEAPKNLRIPVDCNSVNANNDSGTTPVPDFDF
ncbi:MAG: transglycosylase domain-containing protein [Bacteroidetes bacterium]|nr:transglycosylase domain-containing protein [Bacteroidota bacterium]MDA0878993.1 transglycosylase domain-containing protein [Bacteroidota bacterium]MDA1115900.1 transglycosylase domain-containing protein [Bacteroidota bacterium]